MPSPRSPLANLHCRILFSYRQNFPSTRWTERPFYNLLWFLTEPWIGYIHLVNLDSLPFRFKGSSANMAPTQTMHHHRSTTKVSHKPFKSKHASKSALKDQAKGMKTPKDP